MSENHVKNKRNRIWLWATLVVVAFVGGVLLADSFEKKNTANRLPEEEMAKPEVTAAAETQAPQPTSEKTEAPASTENSAFFTNQRLQQTLQAQVDSVPDMVERVASGVVGISNNITTMGDSRSFTMTEVTQSSGSGVIISSDGYILTNAHVIENAEKLWVMLENGENVEAHVVGSDTRTDIALLKIDKDNLNYVPLGDSSQIRVGEFVIAIGNPLGDNLAGTVTMGIVSAVDREVTDSEGLSSRMIQTDAAINPGNSGGALLNLAGQLIGINSAKSTLSNSYYSTQFAEGIGFAIPINDVLPIIDELKDKGYVARPMLGVGNVSTVTRSQAEYNDVPVGVLCRSIFDGPAKDAGMQEMDIITELNGKTITTYEELKQALDECKVGQTVNVTFYRMSDKETHTVQITLVSQNDINTNPS